MFTVGQQQYVDESDRIASILEFVVKELVDIPADVSVDVKTGKRTVSLSIKANKSDMGKIIGRYGRIIKALRHIMSAIAAKYNQRVSITVLD